MATANNNAVDDFWASKDQPSDLTGHNQPDGQSSITTLATADDIPAMVKKDVEELTALYKEVLAIFKRAPEEIPNSEIYDRFTALITKLKDAQDERENRKKKIKDPYNKAATAIENAFKLDKDPELGNLKTLLDAALLTLKNRMSTYDTALYEKEQARIQEETARLAEAASKDGIEMAPAAVTQVKLGAQKSEHGGTSVRQTEKVWDIVDESLLPRSVLTLDDKKVQALIDSGATDIPGLNIRTVIKTSVRR